MVHDSILKTWFMRFSLPTLMKILFLFLFAISCSKTNQKTETETKTITFDLSVLPKPTSVKLSDLGFIDIEYIPLETSEQSLISGTNEIFFPIKKSVSENSYLIKRFNTILKFHSSGSFNTRIGTVGRGPNEFIAAHDVKIYGKNENIYLLARWQEKFFVYSENGELLRTFKVPYSPSEFSFCGDGILCYGENHMGNIEYSYNMIDTSGRIIKSYLNKYPFKNHDAYGIENENIFYSYGNQLYKKEVYSDTIFLCEKDGFKPHLVIQVGDKLITPKARSEFKAVDLAKNYIIPLKLFEFADYVYYEFVYKFEPPDDVLVYSFIGSKKNNFQALFDRSHGLINDIDGGPQILPSATKDDNTIIALLDALELKTFIDSEDFKNSKPKYPDKKIKLENIVNTLKETDNPVLVLVKRKD